MQKRTPRFKRVPLVAPMQLDARDCQIIRLVHRHRFLRSDQIVSFIGGSQQQTLRRLKLLFQHGYLERPRAQLTHYANNSSRSLVYGLGSKGGGLLRQEFGLSVDSHAWSERNHELGRVYLEHVLFVADVLLAVELACRKHGGVQLLHEDDLVIHSEKQPLQWRVTVPGGVKLGVLPDRLFALDYTDATGTGQRSYFFLEADRGTMPVKRHSLAQTSFYRKMLAYQATWRQDIHRRHLGIHRFRVLTVTTSAKRVETLVQACSQLDRGQSLFLFGDKSLLSGDVLAKIWQTGRPGEMGGLLDGFAYHQNSPANIG